MEHKKGLVLHVTHVSRKRMTAQGIDGLSWADRIEGMMKGLGMVEFMPLHQDPLERELLLKGWHEQLTQGLNATFLKPKNRSVKGHGKGTFIWTVALAVVEVVVEQLVRARLKNQRACT